MPMQDANSKGCRHPAYDSVPVSENEKPPAGAEGDSRLDCQTLRSEGTSGT
jgi:hypothetical protein